MGLIEPSNINLVGNDEGFPGNEVFRASCWSLGLKEPNIAGIFENFEVRKLLISIFE